MRINLRASKTLSLLILFSAAFVLSGCQSKQAKPVGVIFEYDTLKRLGHRGDNWCMTWAADGSKITSMDDGNWLQGPHRYSNHLYRISGVPDDFTRDDIPAYPSFFMGEKGWFGYGMLSVDGTIYSLVSKCRKDTFSGPIRGLKLLKSTDNGKSWYRVNKDGQQRLIKPMDDARNDISPEEMFFFEESGRPHGPYPAYPFVFCAFVQNGRDNQAAKDDFIYVYSPEGAQSNRLLLARAPAKNFEIRKNWEYFSGWAGDEPTWTKDIEQRDAVYVYDDKNKNGEYFGWYSWLPSVVWNPGLELYIMVNGGTYGGRGMTNEVEDYYASWMHTKTGSLGFWYSENPYGPWKQFYYTDYWTADDDKNLIYQPKLSPKWISADGKKMTFIFSDAMKNEQGKSHRVNYLWNQMKITLELSK